MTPRETAIHLENLRRSHEITRELAASRKPSIILTRNRKTWLADGVPLPFHFMCAARTVAADIAKRFPGAAITVRL